MFPLPFLLRPRLPAHLLVGRRGEGIAVRHLRRIGWRIHARNVRVGRHDEIDIVAWDPEDRVVVFVEVKARATPSDDFHPLLNVTPEKRFSMARAARRWVAKHDWQGGWRLDVLCVAGGEVIDHCRDVAWESGNARKHHFH